MIGQLGKRASGESVSIERSKYKEESALRPTIKQRIKRKISEHKDSTT